MKKLFWYLTAAVLVLGVISSCKREEQPEYPNEAMAKVAQANLVDAAAAAYAVWEEETVLPEKLTVVGEAITKAGELELTQPQYQYALAQAIVDIAGGKKDDIIVLSYKPAQHPERDSYDKDEIAVNGGPALEEGTEDVVSLAGRFLEAAQKNGTIPNQTLVTRKGSDALAYSTNRLTVTMLRVLAEYKKGSALPKNVSTDYLSAAATLKGFAQQFVGILDIWENTVGTVSADGSHCTDNNSAWQNVHFVPIPHSGGAYADGVDQYDAKYQPYFTIEIDGTTYTSAQTWGIALRGILDLITKEGSAKMQENRNPMEHTLGNGASLKEPIPAVTENDIWGLYPWYESTNDGPAINLTEFSPYFVVRCAAWFLTRQVALGKIGNYQFFGTDPDSGFVDEGVSGFVSSMRMWLIAARFYKYLLDNNIEDNVYDAVKDATFSTDLYGVEMPDIDLLDKKVDLDSQGSAVTAKFNAKKAWTATASEPWIHVEPASGDAGTDITLTVTADPNTGDTREGEIILKGGNVTDGLAIPVKQAKYVEPAKASLKEFAEEFVKGLDVWAATVGTVESEGKHLIENNTAWTDVHFIPVGHTGGPYDDHGGNQYDETLYTPWVLNIGGTEYTSAQAWEIAIRGLLNMVIAEGEAFLPTMENRNWPYTLANNKSFSELTMSNPSEDCHWGSYPWYEAYDDVQGLTYNGQPVTEVDVNFMVKVCSWHVVRGLIKTPGNSSPLGAIGNYQEFGTDSGTLNLEGYSGLIAPMRELLVLMRIYKYILDNNIDTNVYDALKDQKFDFDLYGVGVPEAPKPTIADFAKEFAKVADKWDNTVGTVEYTRDGETFKHENVHYVPETFNITLNGTNYNKYQMHEMAMRALKAIEAGGSFTDEIPAPGSYTEATSPYHEYGEPLQEEEAGFDLLSNFATRCLNYLANNGEWPNVCGYPRTSDPVLESYHGYVCVERNLLMLSRFCREIVTKGITDAGSIAKIKVSTDLWGESAGPAKIALKDFAKEFVKGLTVWQNTIGNVDADGIRNQQSEKGSWFNVHFIPIEGNPNSEYYNYGNNQYDPKYTPWKLNVNGTEFSSSQAWEIAIRGLMDMVTAEGDEFLEGMTDRNKAYTLQDGVSFSQATVASTSEYNKWGKHPWYEFDYLVTDNGKAIESVGVDFMVKVGAWHVVRSFIAVGNNNPLCMIGNYQEFGTTSGTLNLGNYVGYISPMRELLVLMRIYKYLLDNNIDSNVYSAIKNQKFDFDLYGAPGDPISLQEFAQEFVKGLDVWENTIGNVDADGYRNQTSEMGAWKNVHFIPIVGNPNSEYYNYGNNQYDPKYTPWKFNVKGVEFSSNQAWEIAIRGLMDMVTKEGSDFLATMDDRNKAYTFDNNGAFSKTFIRPTSADNKWGKHPWYEFDYLVTDNGQEIEKVGLDFIVKVGAWHVVRSFIKTEGNKSPLGMIGNYQEFGTTSGTLNLGNYVGYISPMRELLILMRIYKYMLDNDVDGFVYDALANQAFDFDLYGVSGESASITIDGNFDDWADVPGVEPAAAFNAYKVTNDADNFYFYIETDPGSRLWSGGAYLYLYFNFTNDLTQGAYSGTTGMHDNKYDAYIFMYLFGGSADAPVIENNPNGGEAKGMTMDNIVIAGNKPASSSDIVKMEIVIPRANFATQVNAGDVIAVDAYRSKDGGNIYYPGYVVK
ncbi:MAG: BACON domain-containing protein [Bacteroidales bacterium]|nr:BACON domain-containing protein [Bacteroidales bacterium]